MTRQKCSICIFRTELYDGRLVCQRHHKDLVKRVEGELVPDPDSMQFIQYYDNDEPVYCDFVPKVNMQNPVELEE